MSASTSSLNWLETKSLIVSSSALHTGIVLMLRCSSCSDLIFAMLLCSSYANLFDVAGLKPSKFILRRRWMGSRRWTGNSVSVSFRTISKKRCVCNSATGQNKYKGSNLRVCPQGSCRRKDVSSMVRKSRGVKTNLWMHLWWVVFTYWHHPQWNSRIWECLWCCMRDLRVLRDCVCPPPVMKSSSLPLSLCSPPLPHLVSLSAARACKTLTGTLTGLVTALLISLSKKTRLLDSFVL